MGQQEKVSPDAKVGCRECHVYAGEGLKAFPLIFRRFRNFLPFAFNFASPDLLILS